MGQTMQACNNCRQARPVPQYDAADDEEIKSEMEDQVLKLSILHDLLRLAAERGKITGLNRAIKEGSEHSGRLDLDSADRDTGRTAVHMAAFKGHADAAELLLDKKASVNPVDRKGETPLVLAARAGSLECARVLVDRGASIVAAACAAAIEEGHTDIVVYLKEKEREADEKGQAEAVQRAKMEREQAEAAKVASVVAALDRDLVED